jgi:hypothetical protein
MTKAVLDNYLIGESDILIITPGSSYGAIAAARSGREPYYIDTTKKQCLKGSKSESPPFYKNNQNHRYW